MQRAVISNFVENSYDKNPFACTLGMQLPTAEKNKHQSKAISFCRADSMQRGTPLPLKVAHRQARYYELRALVRYFQRKDIDVNTAIKYSKQYMITGYANGGLQATIYVMITETLRTRSEVSKFDYRPFLLSVLSYMQPSCCLAKHIPWGTSFSKRYIVLRYIHVNVCIHVPPLH